MNNKQNAAVEMSSFFPDRRTFARFNFITFSGNTTNKQSLMCR